MLLEVQCLEGTFRGINEVPIYLSTVCICLLTTGRRECPYSLSSSAPTDGEPHPDSGHGSRRGQCDLSPDRQVRPQLHVRSGPPRCKHLLIHKYVNSSFNHLIIVLLLSYGDDVH